MKFVVVDSVGDACSGSGDFTELSSVNGDE
jgi:hypothetical protein